MKSIVLWLAAALCCGSVHAAVPHQINYQGYLTNAGGTPVNATVSMVLNLYNVSSGGATLYTETQTVTVTNGVFNVLIGAVTPLALPFDVPYYLGIKIDADPEMTPREELVSSPYAIRAASAEALALTATVPALQITGTVSNAASFTGALAGDVTGTQGATVVGAVGAVSAANVAAGANLANAATSANTASTIVKRDAGGNFAAGSPTLSGNLILVNPSTATTGNIMKGSSRFIHGVGFANTFIGEDSGNLTITGTSNTVAGANALGSLTSGGSNTASGYFALAANTSGSYNIALGIGAGGGLTTGDFNIDIGNSGVAGESATIRLGSSQTRTFVAGIRGVTPAVNDALAVVIDSNGQLGTGAAGTVPGTFQWQVVAGTSQQAQSNTGYVANNAAQVTVTLPTAPNVGDTVRVSGAGGGGWKIAQNALQSVSGSYFGLTFIDQWLPRDSVREWSSIASSADGSKLVAAVSGPGGLLYTSIDYGASWTPRETVRNWLSVASSSDGSKLVAVAYFDHPYTSIDSGVTWTQRDVANLRYWSSVASSSDGSKLVAAEGSNGFIYTSIDFGVTWTQRASSGGRLWQSAASSADGIKLVAVAYNDNLFTSTDSGVTWTARDSVRYWKAVASSADGSKLVAAAEGAGGQLFTSTDSGASWTPRESNRLWTAVASSVDGSRLVAVADSAQIYTSSDFGVGWIARETSRRWTAVASSADGIRLVAAERGFGPFGGGLIYTSVPAVNAFAASTTVGVTGYLTGIQRSAIELQYIGSGQFMPLSYVGTIGSY